MGIFDRLKSGKQERIVDNKQDDNDSENFFLRGPYDIEQPYKKMKRLNMGALRIPAIPDMQVHPEPSPKEGYYTSVTLVLENSAMNLMVLSDTKTGETWADLLKILIADATKKGATVDKSNDKFGEELLIKTPINLEDGRTGIESVRFIGVQGSRWILRVIVTGKALEDDKAKNTLEEILENVVVDRGNNPIPPGEILLLDLPEELSHMLQEKE